MYLESEKSLSDDDMVYCRYLYVTNGGHVIKAQMTETVGEMKAKRGYQEVYTCDEIGRENLAKSEGKPKHYYLFTSKFHSQGPSSSQISGAPRI
jgi:hypothetical protein